MTKYVAIIVAVLFVLSSSFFSVAASAADYSKIDISDYVSGREFVGDDVIVTYDLPLRPYTELYGFATGSNTPMHIANFNGNLFFQQNGIDYSYEYFHEDIGYEAQDFSPEIDPMGFYTGQLEYQVSDDYQVLTESQNITMDEYLCVLDWDSVDNNMRIANARIIYDGSEVGRFSVDSYYETLTISWMPEFLDSDDFWISFGRMVYAFEENAEYQRINGKIFPLGRSNGRTNMIAVSDIKSGSGFELSFDLRYYIEHDSGEELNGNIAYYDAVWLDKDFNEISRSQEEIDWAPYPQYYEYQFDIDFTVPQGAAYFYLDFTTGYFYVNTAYEVSWVITDITMTSTLSSIEENSQTMQKVQQKLNKLDQQLGDIKDQLTPTPEQNDKAEQLEQEIGNASDKLENNNSTLEDLTPTRPEINTDLTLDEEKLFAVSPLITNIWSLSGMQGHIGIVVLVATVAYIFFGKRDS